LASEYFIIVARQVFLTWRLAYTPTSMSRRNFHREPLILTSQVMRAVGEVEAYLTLFITCSGGV
jgi:hypothetical protein